MLLSCDVCSTLLFLLLYLHKIVNWRVDELNETPLVSFARKYHCFLVIHFGIILQKRTYVEKYSFCPYIYHQIITWYMVLNLTSTNHCEDIIMF